MNKFKLAAAGFGAGAMMALSAAPGHAAETWTCNIFPGPKHFVNIDTKAWGKDVARVTNNGVKVNFLPSNAAPPPKQLNGIVAGTFDCALIFHGFTAKQAIGPQYAVLPFLNAGSAEIGSVAFWRTWKKHFAEKKEFESKGIKILTQYHFVGIHFFTAKEKPINSLADMKTQKMWALAGTTSRTLKAAGVSHVSGPAARMAEFTQTKVVQGIAGATHTGMVVFAGIKFCEMGDLYQGIHHGAFLRLDAEHEEMGCPDGGSAQGHRAGLRRKVGPRHRQEIRRVRDQELQENDGGRAQEDKKPVTHSRPN